MLGLGLFLEGAPGKQVTWICCPEPSPPVWALKPSAGGSQGPGHRPLSEARYTGPCWQWHHLSGTPSHLPHTLPPRWSGQIMEWGGKLSLGPGVGWGGRRWSRDGRPESLEASGTLLGKGIWV